MAKNFIKKYLPDPELIRSHRSLRLFGRLLQDANLWHLNRRSARGAFAVGLFVAMIPMPFQMVLAAALAIAFRCNLPIAVALCWITNPLTLGPIFYLCYLLGTVLLGQPSLDVQFQPSMDWLIASIDHIGMPFLVGTSVVAVTLPLIGWFSIDFLWCSAVRNAKQARVKRQQEKRS